jgi:hypothetical protein
MSCHEAIHLQIYLLTNLQNNLHTKLLKRQHSNHKQQSDTSHGRKLLDEVEEVSLFAQSNNMKYKLLTSVTQPPTNIEIVLEIQHL